MIFFAKSWRSVYFRSWNGCSTTPCIQWCFSRCFSSCSDENLSQMKSWCTQEGYKCITLAVGVQEGNLFGRYFFRSRSQGVATLVSDSETSRLVYSEGQLSILNHFALVCLGLPLSVLFCLDLLWSALSTLICLGLPWADRRISDFDNIPHCTMG